MSEREHLGSSSRDYGSGAPVPAVGFADFSPTELYNLSENIATNVNTINSGLKTLEKMMKQIAGNNDNMLLRDKIKMSEREHLGSSSRDYGSGAPVPAVGFADFSPTELYNLSENIATNVNTINSGLKTLEKMMKQIGGNNDNMLLRDKVHNTQQSVNQSVSATARDLQRLGVVVRRGDKPQKLQVERLTQAFKDALAKYSTVQKQLTEKMQANMPLPIKQRPNTQLIDVSMADDEEASLLANQQAQARLIEFETSMLLEREAYINKIEADVIDVNAIMTELADIVNMQGATIDTVESQIEAAGSNVETGAEELAKAAQYQNKYRRKMIILFIIALVIAIILIIIIVKSVR